MDINSLINLTVEAIARDNSIKSWSQVMYDQSHQVFENIDIRNPPTPAMCPYVYCAPDSKSIGKTKAIKEHSILVGCVIQDDTREADDDIENLTRYKGSQRIEQFRKVVETSVMGINVGNSSWSIIEVEYDTISRFPFCHAEMTMFLSETVTLGSDPLL